MSDHQNNPTCSVCQNQNTELVCDSFPGYQQGEAYQIFACNHCLAHFISPHDVPPEVNEVIYTNPTTPGYHRYRRYAQEIKAASNPLKFLSKREFGYHLVYKEIDQHRQLKILDVGCGYGYLTYALNQLDHQALGIDRSKKAVEFALDNFGDNFLNISVEEFFKSKEVKFDLIVAIELVEHLPRPGNFLLQGTDHLNPGGKLLISTPNKDYYSTESTWRTDPPPIHTCWLGRKCFQVMSDKLHLDLQFRHLPKYRALKTNYLVNHLLSKKNNPPSPTLSSQNQVLHRRKRPRPVSLQQFLNFILVHFQPIRYISNKLFFIISKERPNLGVTLNKHRQDNSQLNTER